MINTRLLTILALILMVSVFRILPHPPNFTPILAVALFAGAHLSNRALAFFIPLLAMLIADIVLGFHPTLPYVYGAIALIVWAGIWLSARLNVRNVAVLALASSSGFFIVTNFGAWLSLPHLYERSWSGLVTAYIAAIPFFQNALLGDLLYTSLLFGGFYLLQRQYTSLAIER